MAKKLAILEQFEPEVLPSATLIGICQQAVPASRALAFAFAFVLHRDEQFKTHLRIALAARGKLLMRFESGFMRQAVLRVRDLIDPRLRDLLARFVKCLAGIGNHGFCQVALGT